MNLFGLNLFPVNLFESSEANSKKITMSFNSILKWIAIAVTILLLCLAFLVFLFSGVYAIVVLFVLFLGAMDFFVFRFKVEVTKNFSENSIVIQRQAFLGSESIVFSEDEQPRLKLFNIRIITEAYIAAVESKKKSVLLVPSTIFGSRNWFLTKSSTARISEFLAIPVSNDVGNLSEYLKTSFS